MPDTSSQVSNLGTGTVRHTNTEEFKVAHTFSHIDFRAIIKPTKFNPKHLNIKRSKANKKVF